MYVLASICTFRFMLGLQLCQVYLILLSNSESQQTLMTQSGYVCPISI